MTMNSLAESLLAPPDLSKPAFLGFGLGPSPPPLPQQAPYPLQALHSPPDAGAFPPAAPSYGRPPAYPSYPAAAAAAGGSPHAFYHHGASYSPYQQPPSALGHGTRLEETAISLIQTIRPMEILEGEGLVLGSIL
uniref:Uncharacterized protein n=1 Tax=Sphaerodactylus townsendi TaxID=933632 RepID=A0ACB8EV00_9SAUR